MPELPEIETIRSVLSPQIVSRTIEDVEVRRSDIIVRATAEEFKRALTKRTIAALNRRGKYLLLLLDNGCSIAVHLRMTGCLIASPHDFPEEKHTHAVISLSGGVLLRFSDARRFGRLTLLGKGEESAKLEGLGIEPLSGSLDADYLAARLSKGKRAVKTCLLDQSVIAGIGNIYGDEILFRAGIRPDRQAQSLTKDEWRRLADEIPKTLAYYIDKNKISAEDYLQTRGREYRNTPYLLVYGRSGEACKNCSRPLEKTVVSGRSSVYCPHCQK